MAARRVPNEPLTVSRNSSLGPAFGSSDPKALKTCMLRRGVVLEEVVEELVDVSPHLTELWVHLLGHPGETKTTQLELEIEV